MRTHLRFEQMLVKDEKFEISSRRPRRLMCKINVETELCRVRWSFMFWMNNTGGSNDLWAKRRWICRIGGCHSLDGGVMHLEVAALDWTGAVGVKRFLRLFVEVLLCVLLNVNQEVMMSPESIQISTSDIRFGLPFCIPLNILHRNGLLPWTFIRVYQISQQHVATPIHKSPPVNASNESCLPSFSTSPLPLDPAKFHKIKITKNKPPGSGSVLHNLYLSPLSSPVQPTVLPILGHSFCSGPFCVLRTRPCTML